MNIQDILNQELPGNTIRSYAWFTGIMLFGYLFIKFFRVSFRTYVQADKK